MLQNTLLPVVAVTGMTFEARIASGPGVHTVCATRPDTLSAALTAVIAKGCRGVISFGIAGGLVPHLQPGSCIVARSIVTPHQRINTHLEWASRLLQSIPGAVHGDLAGSNRLVALPADKLALGHATGAMAVDMESIVAVRLAAAHGLPFAAVRVVADACHRELPPAAQIGLTAGGSPDLAAVLRSVMAQPRQIGALTRVGLDARAARSALVRARRKLGAGFGLLELGEAVLAPSPVIEAAE
jgi:hopanoid-associated phosphorylase